MCNDLKAERKHLLEGCFYLLYMNFITSNYIFGNIPLQKDLKTLVHVYLSSPKTVSRNILPPFAISHNLCKPLDVILNDQWLKKHSSSWCIITTEEQINYQTFNSWIRFIPIGAPVFFCDIGFSEYTFCCFLLSFQGHIKQLPLLCICQFEVLKLVFLKEKTINMKSSFL